MTGICICVITHVKLLDKNQQHLNLCFEIHDHQEPKFDILGYSGIFWEQAKPTFDSLTKSYLTKYIFGWSIYFELFIFFLLTENLDKLKSSSTQQ